ncbi:MAG: tRNA guanosine(15) transglycosylase TgtA [Halobacteriaceae archaeon]
MRDAFEVRAADGLGRLGDLSLPRSDTTVRTPALLPVVNPNRITVDPGRFREFGAEMCITNAYIIYGDDDLREQALADGLRDVVGFDGPIMTDSGSFQLATYGEIDVDTPEILRFQRDAGADVGTPVDVPTDPDADRETAERDLETTADRLEVAESVDTGDMLVTAPVQGATYPDLRERAAREADATDLDVFPVGGVVPLLNGYRYDDAVEAALAAKRGLRADAPVHLFGAGHPMTFALAVAAGCDLFDSAAYALYARDGRYLTPRGTRQLEDLRALPCGCPVCTEHDPDALRRAADDETERLLAAHNLHTSFAELRRVREAVSAGNLLELVAERAAAHPRVLDGYRVLLSATDQLRARDPASKGTFFYTGPEAARRPEVARHHDRLDRVDPDGAVLLVGPDVDGLPAGLAPEAARWDLRPPFGPVPPALRHTYPLTAETPAEMDRAGYEAAADGVAALADAHPDADVALIQAGWPATALDRLPDCVTVHRAGDQPDRGTGAGATCDETTPDADRPDGGDGA